MKISATILIIACFFFAHTSHAQKNEVKYNLSVSKSLVKWKCYDDEIEYVGSFKLKSGYITMKDEVLSSAVVFVDTKSIKCQKCGDQEDIQDLIRFIKSSSFLNTNAMDYAVFKMSSSDVLSDSKEGNYKIKGNLTIIGYSNEVNFPLFIEVKKGKLTAEGGFKLNRDLWNLKNPKKADDTYYTMESTMSLNFLLESE